MPDKKKIEQKQIFFSIWDRNMLYLRNGKRGGGKMAIQFILGNSGTGKTTYLYNKMIEASMKEGHNPIIFLLPEQSNMAAEQEMVMRHPMGGTMDISILSFTRLAFKVFDELNIHTQDILDDFGKSMLIMKLMKEHKEEFSYYGNMMGKTGFVEEIKSILSEFYQYQITDAVLENVLKNLSPQKSLYHKLSDLRILLRAFEEEMQGSYMVTEQILSLLKEVISESELLRGADIYIDGFTGFSPVQYDVLEELMKLGGNVYFAFTMEEEIFGQNDYSEQGLFALEKKTVDKLCMLAQDNQIKVLSHIGRKENYRLAGNKELLHLEQQIFRFPFRVYPKETEMVKVVSAKEAKEEALYVAKTIKEKVMKEGYHYRDFAIITGDLQEQANLWKQVMEQLEIPYFLDFREPLVYNPIVETISMVMELFRTDFSYESVFSLLKTGFLEIEAEQIYRLENYALKHGVRGYSWWSKAFRGGVKGLHEINETRGAFMEKMEKIAPIFLKRLAPAAEYIHALYEFMAENKMAEKLKQKEIWLEEQGNIRQAKAYSQVYEKFISVLDKTMVLLGEEEVQRDHFMEILLTGIADIHLGIIPSTLDQVIIGDIERTRLREIKVMFVTGTNEGLIPKGSTQRKILLDKDREKLKELQVTLAPDSKEEMFLQQYYLYLQITQAKEQIVFLYRNVDGKGAELSPSYFIKRLSGIFPKLTLWQAGEKMKNSLPVTRQELTAEFSKHLEHEQMTDSSVFQVMKENNPEGMNKILDGYFYTNSSGVLDKAIAKKLYGNYMVHSVSRLENYAGCAYQFFLKYGLKLEKRKEYQLETSDIGSILHTVMERFFHQVKEGVIKIEQMTPEAIDKNVEMMTVVAAKEINETIFERSSRNRHRLDVLIRIAKRSVKNLCRHLTQGEMKPAYIEQTFSPADKLDYINMVLEEDLRMSLRGIVDRVDIKETEEAVYFDVIDYKSGAKDIDYLKIYEGKQLQLAVYMSVMLEHLKNEYPGKKIIPTGMYYYQLADPVVEESEEEKIEQKRIEGSRLSGLVNQEEESLQAMDKKTGLVTPVRYKKDGEFDSRNTALVSTDELLQISEFVREKMMDIGENIIHGEIPMNPEKGEYNCPCNYCDYQNVCRFEPGLGGNAYRIQPDLDKKEAKKRIKKEEGEQA